MSLLSIFSHRLQIAEAEGRYWRKAYETLVEQTGRDLNDGYGIDPRKPKGPDHDRPDR